MRNKILSLLVLLLTAATGAWAADTYTITFSGFGNEACNKTVTDATLEYSETFNVTDVDANFMTLNGVGGSNEYVSISKSQAETQITITVKSAFEGTVNVTVDYVNGGGDESQSVISVTCVKSAPTIEVTTDAASEGATFTEATFKMPTFDATVNYDIVRDMAVQMTTKVGDGADGADYRIRLKKKDDKWEPADLTVAQVMGKFKVHDALENKDLTFYGEGAVCAISIYAVDDQDQPTGNAIAFADLVPGRYVAIATAADGTAYDGQTPQSNVLVLFQGYEVTVPSKEFVTYYKDEPLYADPQTSADAELYTITSVSNDQAVLSDAIATAPSNTPLLIYNAGNTDQTFLLIPADAEPNLALTVAPEFIGTTEATTIAASTSTKNNYAFNGKQFVWVKNALAIGANKCWLAIPVTSNARTINLVFDDGSATGIRSMDNGQLIMDNWYDLNGRKLNAAPTRKGIYIQNGRKVVVK